MTAIKVEAFSGLTPRLSHRLIGDRQATSAINVDLLSGDIRAIRTVELVHTPSIPGPWLTTYRAESGGVETWRDWVVDVDVIQMPLDQDIEQRFAWAGDGEPRYATFAGFGTTDWALGIPKPLSSISASHSGGSGAVETRLYTYTFINDLGEESGPAASSSLTTGKVDGTWALSGMDTSPTNSGTFTGVHALGVTTCTASGKHYLRSGDPVVINGATYSATVTSNTVFKVTGDVSAHTTWARKAYWNTSGLKQRIYRTAGTSASYQMVVEQSPSATFNDTIATANIPGDELITDGWEPPPVGLRGIGVLPSGAAFGFVGNLLCFSEPYQLHAWPTKYQLGANYPIVATASFGTTVVVATTGVPYYADGIDPATASLQKVDQVWPCLSKRSIVSDDDGVMFATAHGLAYIGLSGSRIWTDALYTPNDWRALNPASMISVAAYGKILVSFIADGETQRKTLVFMPGEQVVLTTLDIDHDELYADPRNGRLYFVDYEGVNLYDSGVGPRLPYEWRSKEYAIPTPVNFGAAKIDLTLEMTQADADQALADYNAAVAANAAKVAGYSGFGAINGAGAGFNETMLNASDVSDVQLDDLEYATFTMFSHGKMMLSKTVSSSQAFRLPAGFKTDNVAFQINGTTRIHSIKIAETMSELKSI